MAAGVAKLATSAVHAFTSCVVPKLTGKPLASARKAITHGACAVGKIRYASSSSVKKGRVISQQPKARKKLAYHAKVSLVVSKG
jgi:beta-lactam-binding protein with PASTA domain